MSPAVKAHAVRRATEILDRLQPIGLDAVVVKHLWLFLAFCPSREEIQDFLAAMEEHFGSRQPWTRTRVRALVHGVSSAMVDFGHMERREALEALRYVVGWVLRFAEITPNAAHPATE